MFNDRFIYDNPTFDSIDLSKTNESTLLSMSGELQRMVDSIRRVDATLSRATVQNIYYVITEYADPKIGGILASAKDANTNERIFGSIEEVQQIMFSEFENLELNIFNDMVRQASVTLAASRLVGNLAPAGANFQNQSKFLHDSAVKDIERIVQSIDITQLKLNTEDKNLEENYLNGSKFIFDSYSFQEVNNFKVEVFLSGITSAWTTVNTYNGNITVANIVSDITDFINSQTLSSVVSNILAAPVLNYEKNRHAILFSTRSNPLNVSTEIISIRFLLGGSELTTLPFKWGNNEKNLNNYAINSLILLTQKNSSETKSISEEVKNSNSILYFRRKSELSDTIELTNEVLRYRVSTDNKTYKNITFPYSLETKEYRASELAFELLNSLYENRELTNCIGSIIKSDPISVSQPVTALELISYTTSANKPSVVLDILEVPRDIEMAIGNLNGPITSFSDKPRSIRVDNVIDMTNKTPEKYREESGKGNKPHILSRPPSTFLNRINQKVDSHQGRYNT